MNFETGAVNLRCSCLLPAVLPTLRIVLAPPQKTEVVALQSWRNTRGNHRRLDSKGARATHRIEQSCCCCKLRTPSRLQQQRCREMLFQRCSGMFQPITAAVQAFTRKIEADTRLVMMNVYVYLNIGLLFGNRRPIVATFTKLVDNRILDAQSRIMPMIQL